MWHPLRELIAVTQTATAGALGSKAMAAKGIDALLRLKVLAEATHAEELAPDPEAIA